MLTEELVPMTFRDQTTAHAHTSIISKKGRGSFSLGGSYQNSAFPWQLQEHVHDWVTFDVFRGSTSYLQMRSLRIASSASGTTHVNMSAGHVSRHTWDDINTCGYKLDMHQPTESGQQAGAPESRETACKPKPNIHKQTLHARTKVMRFWTTLQVLLSWEAKRTKWCRPVVYALSQNDRTQQVTTRCEWSRHHLIDPCAILRLLLFYLGRIVWICVIFTNQLFPHRVRPQFPQLPWELSLWALPIADLATDGKLNPLTGEPDMTRACACALHSPHYQLSNPTRLHWDAPVCVLRYLGWRFSSDSRFAEHIRAELRVRQTARPPCHIAMWTFGHAILRHHGKRKPQINSWTSVAPEKETLKPVDRLEKNAMKSTWQPKNNFHKRRRHPFQQAQKLPSDLFKHHTPTHTHAQWTLFDTKGSASGLQIMFARPSRAPAWFNFSTRSWRCQSQNVWGHFSTQTCACVWECSTHERRNTCCHSRQFDAFFRTWTHTVNIIC